jgi:transposase-like protein
LVPFLSYPDYIRKAIFTTNVIESLNRSLRKNSKNRGSFPNDESAFRVEEYLEEVDNAYQAIEASFESVCDFVSRKVDRKLTYGLVKNKKPFFTGPTGSATALFNVF